MILNYGSYSDFNDKIFIKILQSYDLTEPTHHLHEVMIILK